MSDLLESGGQLLSISLHFVMWPCAFAEHSALCEAGLCLAQAGQLCHSKQPAWAGQGQLRAPLAQAVGHCQHSGAAGNVPGVLGFWRGPGAVLSWRRLSPQHSGWLRKRSFAVLHPSPKDMEAEHGMAIALPGVMQQVLQTSWCLLVSKIIFLVLGLAQVLLCPIIPLGEFPECEY